MLPSEQPLASSLPSGLQASEKTAVGCSNSLRGVPRWASQSRTIASSPPLASRPPPGEKASQVTLSASQPAQSRVPLATSHSLTLPSEPPLASARPSGLNVRFQTISERACQIWRRISPPPPHPRIPPRLRQPAHRPHLLLLRTASSEHKLSVRRR